MDAASAIWTAVLTAVGGAGAAWIGAYFLFRGKKVEQETEETKAEATATSAFLEGQTAFQAYVNGVVTESVRAKTADFERQLEELRAQLKLVREESHEMNDAIRSRETQLWLWNIHNSRSGPMPELPLPILKRLGITHLSSMGDVEEPQPVPEEEP